MNHCELYVCAYGKNNIERGIVKLCFDLESEKLTKEFVLPIDGKCNLVSEYHGHLYLSVKNNQACYIEEYDAETYECINRTPTEYFYSYGQIVDDKFLLASYESGVDSVFDLKTRKFEAHCVHHQDGLKAKSHYIQMLDDGQIIGIENGLQHFYIYENLNLDVKKIIEYPPINIRLLSIHPDGKTAYLNTEYSNELIALDTSNWEIISRWKMADGEGVYSGGNAIRDDGNLVCASVRGQDRIHAFYTNDGLLIPVGSFGCGKIPRDLKFVLDYLFVSCTEDDKVEVYDLSDCLFRKCAEIDVLQPITFEMESKDEREN